MTQRLAHKCDLQGRPYLPCTEAKACQTIWLDGDFTCHAPGPVVIVEYTDANKSLYFQCNAGIHFLDGQRKGTIYLGLYPTDPGPMEHFGKLAEEVSGAQ